MSLIYYKGFFESIKEILTPEPQKKLLTDIFIRNVVASYTQIEWMNESYDYFGKVSPKNCFAVTYSEENFAFQNVSDSISVEQVIVNTRGALVNILTPKGSMRPGLRTLSEITATLRPTQQEVFCLAFYKNNLRSNLNKFWDHFYNFEADVAQDVFWKRRFFKSEYDAVFRTLLQCLSKKDIRDKRVHKNNLMAGLETLCQNASKLRSQLLISENLQETTVKRYLSEDRKIAQNAEFEYLIDGLNEGGLSNMERSALLYKIKLACYYRLNTKALRELSTFPVKNALYFETVKNMISDIFLHLLALQMIFSIKRNTTRDKNKRKGARYVKPHTNDFLLKAVNEANEDLRTPITFLYLTGLRPIELEMGIKIMRRSDRIHFEIPGAKIREKDTGGSGQIWRRFSLSLTSMPEVCKALLNIEEGKRYRYRFARTKLWDRIRKLRCEIPELSNLRAYHFRHGFASVLKSRGMPPILIAESMGHQSTRTQAKYGHSRERKSGTKCHPGNSIADIDAATDVREYENSYDFEQKSEVNEKPCTESKNMGNSQNNFEVHTPDWDPFSL